jgi:hypothetical protein
MNISKLKPGMVIKNYKELCELLEEKVKNGAAKVYQMKLFDTLVKYKKVKYSFHIEEIYKTPTKLLNKRNISTKRFTIKSRFSNYKLFLCNESNKDLSCRSIEKIKFRCQNCFALINKKICNVLRKSEPICNNCKAELNLAKLSMYERKIFNELKLFNLCFDREVLIDDLKTSNGAYRFDFVIYKNKIPYVIEYDGEFHDITESIKINDLIKTKYCQEKGIELLRINYKEKLNWKSILYEFLAKHNICNIDSLVISLSEEKEKLLERIKEIEFVLIKYKM